MNMINLFPELEQIWMSKKSKMHGLACVLQIEGEYFRMYPEVIFVDCIANTNKDEQALFTATGENSNGKMFTCLRAFLPNQQAWVFCWLFSVVFPNVY